MAKADLRSLLTIDERASLDGDCRAALLDYIEQINDTLNDNLLDLFDYLIADRRTNRSSREARYRANSGNNSVSVVLRGRKQGAWYDHAIPGGGYPIQAIRRYLGLDFIGAINWAADRYGLPRYDAKAIRRENAEKLAKEREEREQKRAEKLAKAAEADAIKQANDIKTASRFWDSAKDIAGTPGEVYLRNTRQIEEVRAYYLSKGGYQFPDSIRWNDKERALVFAVTDNNNALVGVQLVAVTPDGKQDKTRYGKAGAKLSRGPIGLGSVKFPAIRPGGPILYAEGPETGLTLSIATGHETRVVLGASGFRRIINEAPRDQKIILCRDDDSNDKPAYRAAVAGLFTLANAGYDVWDCWPFSERRQNGDDFNDLLIEEGLDAVNERIDAAISEQFSFTRIEHSLSKAEALVESRVGQFFNEAISYKAGDDQIVCAFGVDTGGGKTHAAIAALVKFIIEIRQKGDKRPVVIAVPEHRLSKEVAKRIRDAISKAGANLSVAIWRGRDALKPNAKNDTDRMCDEADLVREAADVLADIETEVCDVCPHGLKHNKTCQYQLQRGIDADIWVGSHLLIFREPPKPMMKNGGIAALIVDEDIVGAGIRAPFELTLDAFDYGAMALPKDQQDMVDLADYRHRQSQIFNAAPEGYLHRDALSLKGYEITPELADSAPKLIWSRKIERKHEKDWRKREANKTLTKEVSVAKALADLVRPDGPESSGFIHVSRNKDLAKVIRVSHRAQVHEDWRVPTLILDAMHYDTRALKFFWPTVKDLGRVNIATPHQKIIQVVDRSYSLSWLAPPKKKRAKKNKAEIDPLTIEPVEPELKDLSRDARARATEKNRREVAASILSIAQSRGGDTLVVGNKDVVQALKFPPQANIKVAWYGAMAGLDQYGHVRTLIVLGRPLPSPGAVEAMAATLTGEGVTTLKADPDNKRSSWYRRDRDYRLRRVGGVAVKVPAEVDCHPDAMVERLRWQECVGAIMQAIGRGRGTRRGPDNPLDVVVMTDVVLPVPVDEFILAEDLEPSVAQLQLASKGIAFETPACAATAYPDLWPSPDAYRMAVKREDEASLMASSNCAIPKSSRTFPYKYIYRELFACFCQTHCLHISFKLAGNGQHRQSAIVDPALVADPRAAITSLVGELDWLTIEGAPVEALPVASVVSLAVNDTGPPLTAPPEPDPPARCPLPANDDAEARDDQTAILRDDDQSREDQTAIWRDGDIKTGPDEAPDDLNDSLDTALRSANLLTDTFIASEEFTAPPTAPDLEDSSHISGELIPTELWGRLWSHVRDCNMSHKSVADHCEISLPYLSNIEAGRRGAPEGLRAKLEHFILKNERVQESLF